MLTRRAVTAVSAWAAMLALGGAGLAWACSSLAPGAYVAVNPTQGAVGAPVTVTGSNMNQMGTSTPINVVWLDQNNNYLSTLVTVPGADTFTVSVTVPQAQPGYFYIGAYRGSFRATPATFTVLQSNGSPPPTLVTIQAPNATRSYGVAGPATFTPTYSGLTGGDTHPATPPTCTTTAVASSDAGGYPITCSGAADPKYYFRYVSGTLTITRAATAVAASPLRSTRFHPSARLTRPDTGAPLAGQALVFSAGRTDVCSATTDAAGVGTCGDTYLVSTNGFTAAFGGATDYLASSTHGKL